MLYYLGYLTTCGEEIVGEKLKVPNFVMRDIYSDFFIRLIEDDAELNITNDDNVEIAKDIAYNGSINEITKLLHKYLENLSNRDYERFDEKYVKLIFYCLAMNLKNDYYIKSEMEIQRNYPDILLIPKETDKGYYSVLIEFKYLKKNEKRFLKEKQKGAREQVLRYAEFEEIKKLKNLKKYAVVAVVDNLYVEEI